MKSTSRKWLLLAVFCLSLLLLTAAASAEPVRIWLATDMHHLSPELTDYGSLFYSVVYTNDGKLTEHSGELTDAFLQKAIDAHADAVIVTGDVTFDGELKSLEDIAAKFKACQEAGVPVLVLPGNHDISSVRARYYFANKSRPVDNFSQAKFEEICSCLGRDQALARDEASFSFIYPLGENLWLLMLDANTDNARIGAVPEATLVWLEEWLQKARDEGKTVLSFSHQNLLPVNELYYDEFTIINCAAVLKLYREYGVAYSFSGHSHIQHVTTLDGLTEYVTGPLCVSPLHYAVITANGADVNYEAFTMNMYQEEAVNRFRAPMLAGMKSMLNDYTVTEEEREIMADFAATINQAYFAGDWETIRSLKDSRGWNLWRTKALGSFWYTYIWSIFEEY